MSVNSVNSKKSSREIKIARFQMDMLAVFKSPNNIPVPQEDALKLLTKSFNSKTPPKVNKCVMQIWLRQKEAARFVLKSKNKNKVLETFSLDSVGSPSCSQISIGKFEAQSLVFLPVLNRENISELFIFHPYNIAAQNVVIKIAELLESRNNHLMAASSQKEVTNGGYVSENVILREQIKNNDQDDMKSLYSISSNFINNWYGKLNSLQNLKPSAISSIASVNEELYTLNQNLKEIRLFLNNLFSIIHTAVNAKRLKQKESEPFSKNGTNSQVIHLPPKANFLGIIGKIKTCLNLAAAHEQIIINPSSEEIINQLFLFLRIIGDATMNNVTGNPDLVSSIKYPLINSTTVKFFTKHLNPENAQYWSILGPNFGYMNFSRNFTNDIEKITFDEFQVRITPLASEDQRQYPLTLPKPTQFNYHSSSPSPNMDNVETNYRTFPRMYEPERKTPLFLETDSLQYQKSAPHSPLSICHFHCKHSSWDDRQCRFIDAVQIRNGKLGRVIYDRPAKNFRELSVTYNEVVEVMREYGDVVSIKNAIGEIGECPKSAINDVLHY